MGTSDAARGPVFSFPRMTSSGKKSLELQKHARIQTLKRSGSAMLHVEVSSGQIERPAGQMWRDVATRDVEVLDSLFYPMKQ
jgi:hypothetical protein